MAKFLNTSATNFYLEELIKGANERLILISPFLKLNDRIRELLEDKNRLKIDVRIVYGKSELQPEEINWLKELSFVRTSFCKNLHAKCYLNQDSAIITSLNLYEFSQVNNNEMGVFISRDEDSQMYKDTFDEAQRIIRISDEVRISLEKVIEEEKQQDENQKEEKIYEKLSTSKIAKSLDMKTQEFLDKLKQENYLDESGALTQKGRDAGGELKNSKRFGDYFLWPTDFKL